MKSSVIPDLSARKQRQPFHMTERRRRALYGYLFILPTVLFFLAFVAYPFFQAIGISLTTWHGFDKQIFVGLKNFKSLFSDPLFWLSLKNTLIFTLITTGLQTILPLLIAVLLIARWRGEVVVRTIMFLPVIISMVVVGLLWHMIYDGNFGVLNNALTFLGLGSLTHAWLADPHTVMGSIIIVSLWASLGFYVVIFFAGLQGIPVELYEVASIDGANTWQKLTHITVPLLWPVTTVVMILNIIGGIKVFDVIYVMSSGGPDHASEVLGTYLYATAFSNQAGDIASLGYAAAIGFVILILCVIGTVIQLQITGGRADVY